MGDILYTFFSFSFINTKNVHVCYTLLSIYLKHNGSIYSNDSIKMVDGTASQRLYIIYYSSRSYFDIHYYAAINSTDNTHQ